MRSLTAALAVALLLAGCDATTDPDPAAPAVLAPDAFSFEADAPTALTAGPNYTNAALRVGIVSTIIGANLILPSAATHAATRTEPYVEDGVWVWESTFQQGADPVTFRLEGEPIGREVRWRLGITNDELDDFTLYTARTDFDGETGDWQLFYEIDGERTEVLRADFVVEDADTRELAFSIPPGRDAAGSSVLYVHDDGLRVFDWHEEPADLDHYVQWDAVTGVGYIEADNYRNGERGCWDGSLEDVDCPSS